MTGTTTRIIPPISRFMSDRHGVFEIKRPPGFSIRCTPASTGFLSTIR